MNRHFVVAGLEFTKSLSYGTKYVLFANIPQCLHRGNMLHQHKTLALGFKRNHHFCLTSLSNNQNYPDFLTKTCAPIMGNIYEQTCKRALHSTRYLNQNDSENKSEPIILYLQNPIRCLMNKLDFGMLRLVWDSDFREHDFRNGAKLAISSITQILSSNKFVELSGLLTPSAIKSLRYKSETEWTDELRRNVSLNKDEIKVALPTRVRLHRYAEKKLCDIDMVFFAVKKTTFNQADGFIVMEIKARFHRDYTDGLVPDWIVTFFEISRFKVIPR